ncbi:MAG: polysaccharide biosynthesis tyrosine autokinase [Rivularia sp. ALOHA_DT_140]|nr:polysaccharide biosynthesis tyrosine autokinase [Rivularia sp. ALOHA_DT_140]
MGSISRVINLSSQENQNRFLLSEDELKQNLEVEEITGTDILTVGYKSKDSKLATFVVNGIMEAYIENNRLVNRSEALTARKFIAQQLPETQESVRKAEQALRSFQEKNQLVAIDEEAKLSLETVEKLKSQIAEANANFADVNAKYRDLIDKLGMDYGKAIVVAKLSQSEAVQATLAEIQTTQQQLKLDRIRFQDENPRIINLEDKLTSLRNQLQQRIVGEVGNIQTISEQYLQAGELETALIKQLINLHVEKVGLSNHVDSLKDNLSKYQQRINSLPRLKEQEREIQRRLEAAQSTYETLLTKLKEIEAVGNQNVVNARIIEEASEPKEPALDKKITLLLIINNVAVLIIFIASIIILEKKDVSLKTVKSIQQILPYSLLATIPTLKKKQNKLHNNLHGLPIEIPVLDNPHSPTSEVYRMLQANLEFIGSDKQPKVIVVSSSVSQEGKSTVAANLAVVFAESKKKVLLIDGDMRAACQHHVWQINNDIGLSNVIVGRAKISEAITTIMSNLDVLPSGVTPPNSVALLKSQAMVSLIKDISKDYDYVVIDAPPILMAADALILGKIADGILMVSRPGVVDSNNAVNTKGLPENKLSQNKNDNHYD